MRSFLFIAPDVFFTIKAGIEEKKIVNNFWIQQFIKHLNVLIHIWVFDRKIQNNDMPVFGSSISN